MLLNEQQFRQVSSAVDDLTPTQLAWVGGYLSGLSQAAVMDANTAQLASSAAMSQPVISEPANQAVAINATVLYGTQTGNSKIIAGQLQQKLNADGVQAELLNIKDYKPQRLKKEQWLFIVISTQGNGDPPDEARAFFKFLWSDRAPSLSSLQYSVLALGDASYDEFCQAGSDVDKRLEELGAQALVSRVDCDLDFADPAAQWQQSVSEALPKPENNVIPLRPDAQQLAVSSNENAATNFQAEVLVNQRLTTLDSDKAVYHLELDIEAWGIHYQPGDVLALRHDNPSLWVEAVLQFANLPTDASVSVKGKQQTLIEVLAKSELTSVTKKQLRQYAEIFDQQTLLQQLEQDANPEWLADADWVDVLDAYPAPLDSQSFAELLRPLQPRQYSIASSPKAHEGEVHLLIKQVQYSHLGREHKGLMSNVVAELQAGDAIEVSLKPNEHFKLPTDPEKKIIMIGAGTGVAPFRSFLLEREALGVQGNSWLFFGEQHFRSEFLYQTEWQELLNAGVLGRMDVAFSRDQVQKIYVQHRLLEQAETLYQWLQEGALIYVCGDMHKMAKDVHQALIQILQQQGGLDAEQADVQLEQWISDKRYQRDIY